MSRISAWINVIIGALIMVATLPGRTQGLGLITEPLLRDLHLDRVCYAHLNLWATLSGLWVFAALMGLSGGMITVIFWLLYIEPNVQHSVCMMDS